MQRRYSTALIPIVILIAAALRLALVVANTIAPLSPLPVVDLRGDPAESELAELGVTDIVHQQFDPAAVVAVQAGPDAMPGVAGADDNSNGVIDDRLELGATRSDDVCSVLTKSQLDNLPSDQIMVLDHGAFVPLGDQGMKPETVRAIVFGTDPNGKHWSVVVDLGNGNR